MAGLLDYLQNQKPVKQTGEGPYLRQRFPKLYGALGGLLGTAPDEFDGSVLDPLTAEVRKGAEMGYLPGLIAGSAPPMKGAAGLAGLAGMFVGKGSKTWDAVQATRAMELEKAGVDARKIWSETGTWKAPDGAWRQEIPDNTASFHNQFPKPSAKEITGTLEAQDLVRSTDELKRQARAAGGFTIPGFYADKPGLYDKYVKAKNMLGEYEAKYVAPTQKSGILEKFVTHDDLYDAYPSLSRMPTVHNRNHSGGAYSENSRDMLIGGGNEKSIAMHEAQHAIQQREKWARGGSPGDGNDAPFVYGVGPSSKRIKEVENLFEKTPYGTPEYDKLTKEYEALQKSQEHEAAFEGYRRLAGEAEARATQARIPLDAAQRRALFPADSYDVLMDQLIIRGLLK